MRLEVSFDIFLNETRLVGDFSRWNQVSLGLTWVRPDFSGDSSRLLKISLERGDPISLGRFFFLNETKLVWN